MAKANPHTKITDPFAREVVDAVLERARAAEAQLAEAREALGNQEANLRNAWAILGTSDPDVKRARDYVGTALRQSEAALPPTEKAE